MKKEAEHELKQAEHARERKRQKALQANMRDQNRPPSIQGERTTFNSQGKPMQVKTVKTDILPSLNKDCIRFDFSSGGKVV